MRVYPILFLALGLTLAACDDSGGPSTEGTEGTLVVSTSTGGNDPDPDGYLLTVDGVHSRALFPAGTAEIDLPAGQHTLRLLGMAEYCSVSPGIPLDVDVPSRDTTSVAFEVTCLATGVHITATTTGLDFDSDGYRVEVDGTERGILPSNGTMLARLEPGSHTIALTGLSPNCTIVGLGSLTVTVVDTELAPIDFAAACTATSGVIGVIIAGSGVGAVYEAMVDGETSFQVGPGGSAYLGGVPAGDHVVSLNAPVNCSVQTGPQSVTVTAGSLIRDTVEVTFSTACVGGYLVISAATTGTIPAGRRYSAWLCAPASYYGCAFFSRLLGTVAPNGSLVAVVRAGTYQLELRDIPANCRVQRSNPTPAFTVRLAGRYGFAFRVSCTP